MSTSENSELTSEWILNLE
ncbi:hypothetical protein Golob_025735, partial [Gossypium lobatum]|nr:hypothetical protein [Gossypium lobatum]